MYSEQVADSFLYTEIFLDILCFLSVSVLGSILSAMRKNKNEIN